MAQEDSAATARLWNVTVLVLPGPLPPLVAVPAVSCSHLVTGHTGAKAQRVEPPWGVEPQTYALRGCSSAPLDALPAPIAHPRALTALRDLGERDPSCQNSCRRPSRKIDCRTGERRIRYAWVRVSRDLSARSARWRRGVPDDLRQGNDRAVPGSAGSLWTTVTLTPGDAVPDPGAPPTGYLQCGRISSRAACGQRQKSRASTRVA